RWMTDFQIDGFRIDSIQNVANWDFLREFREGAHQLFTSRCSAHGLSQTETDARFLVVGEELNYPPEIISQNCVTALWNDNFHQTLREALVGTIPTKDFESRLDEMINC